MFVVLSVTVEVESRYVGEMEVKKVVIVGLKWYQGFRWSVEVHMFLHRNVWMCR